MVLVGYFLKLVAKVDNNGAAHGGYVNPFTVSEELKAADLVVLEEEDTAGWHRCGTSDL